MAKAIKTRVLQVDEGRLTLTRYEMEVETQLTNRDWDELPASVFEERIATMCARYLAEHHGPRWAGVMVRHLREQGLVDESLVPNSRSEAA